MATEIKYVSLQRLAYYDEKIKAFLAAADTETLTAAQNYVDTEIENANFDPAGTAATLVSALENGQVKANKEALEALQAAVGDLDNLQTTAKSDLVTAINEVRNSVSAGGTAAAVTMETSTTTEGVLKSYTIKQGDNVVGTIDIPKDMVVESGEVVVDPEGQDEGTYIKLVLANVAEPLYINVGTLVDIYKAKESAAQVQITIDSYTREINAEIVDGSVDTDALADNAVTTVKIADGNVTKTKLSTTLQASIDKADAAAPQTALDAEIERAEAAEAQALADAKDYADGVVATEKARAEEAEGDLSDRLDAVEAQLGTGEGSVDEKIATAKQNAKDYTDAEIAKIDTGVMEVKSGSANGTIYVDGTDVAVKGLGSAAYTDASAYDAAGAATTAETNAKAYADEKVAAIDLSGIDANAAAISTNVSDIDKLEAAIGEGGSVTVAIADAKKAGTDAAAAAATNAEAITALQSADTAMDERVAALEAIEHTEITEAEIDSMFE